MEDTKEEVMEFMREVARILGEDVTTIYKSGHYIPALIVKGRTFYLSHLVDYMDHTPEQAAEMIRLSIEHFDEPDGTKEILRILSDRDLLLSHVELQLVAKPKDLGISAEKYGFPDLWLVPIVVMKGADGWLSTCISRKTIERLGISEDLLYQKGFSHIPDPQIKILSDAIWGFAFPDDYIYYVSNNKGWKGAASVIPALDKLHEMFPSGFYLVPSSIHEVLVFDQTLLLEGSDRLDLLVQYANCNNLSEDEILSDHVYLFAKEDCDGSDGL